MELFLNILWLSIALGILGAWRVRWVGHGRGGRHHAVAEWTAIGSALILLFFAISLSDDLHQDVILLSESSTSRRHAVIAFPDLIHRIKMGPVRHSVYTSDWPFCRALLPARR